MFFHQISKFIKFLDTINLKFKIRRWAILIAESKYLRQPMLLSVTQVIKLFACTNNSSKLGRFIQQDIFSFGNPKIDKEHWLQIYPPLSHFDHFVMRPEAIFSHLRPFYEPAVSDLDPQRFMHRPVQVAHNSFIDGLHTTKNMSSDFSVLAPSSILFQDPLCWIH